jgi:hypothetical protein
MPNHLHAAAVAIVIIGVVHSIVGEMVIFRRLRRGTLVPTLAPSPLRVRHLRILWATWHVVTVLGCALAAVLWRMADPEQGRSLLEFVEYTAMAACLVSSLVVLVGTRGRHPGWLGLLAAAWLVWRAHGA